MRNENLAPRGRVSAHVSQACAYFFKLTTVFHGEEENNPEQQFQGKLKEEGIRVGSADVMLLLLVLFIPHLWEEKVPRLPF